LCFFVVPFVCFRFFCFFSPSYYRTWSPAAGMFSYPAGGKRHECTEAGTVRLSSGSFVCDCYAFWVFCLGFLGDCFFAGTPSKNLTGCFLFVPFLRRFFELDRDLSAGSVLLFCLCNVCWFEQKKALFFRVEFFFFLRFGCVKYPLPPPPQFSLV